MLSVAAVFAGSGFFFQCGSRYVKLLIDSPTFDYAVYSRHFDFQPPLTAEKKNCVNK